MEIEKIKINNYGQISNKNINLEKINIIFGKNESGKSTLLNFVINLFYNISKNKNGKKYSDYEKYFPWNENEFSGKIIYKLDNNKKYEVYRNFNKKNPEIIDENGNDISNNFNIDKKTGNLFFSDQIKLDRETLLSTVVASQNETIIDVNNQNLLIQKVANLAESGDEDISYKKSIAKLDKLLLTEVGTEKSQDRPINIAKENIKKYENELEDIKEIEDLKYSIEEKSNKINEEIIYEKNNQVIYEKINTVLKNNRAESEQIDVKKRIFEENKNKIEKLKEQKENNKNKKSNIIFYSILAMLILLCMISFIFIKNKIVNFLLIGLIIIWSLIIFIKNKKINSKNLKLQIEALENNNLELKKEINNLEEKLKEKNQKEKDELIKIYGKEIEDLFNYKLLEQVQSENKNNLDNLNLELHKLKLNLENIEPKIEKIAELEEKLDIEKNNLEKLEEKNDAFKLAKEILQDAYTEMKNSVTPKFNNNLSKNIEKLSNHKYKKVSLNDGIMVELDNGKYILADLLSTGTIEQIYLALRLSVIDEISPEKLPIFLDETFAYYDDERLESALKFLTQIDNQILIFTCTKREMYVLDKLKIKYNLVEL